MKNSIKHTLHITLFVYYWIECAIHATLRALQGKEREKCTRNGVEISMTSFVWSYAGVAAVIYIAYWFRDA